MNEAQKIARDVLLEHNEKVRVNENASALLEEMPKMKALLEGKGVSDFGGLLLDSFEDFQALVESGGIIVHTTAILSYDTGVLKVFGSAKSLLKHKFLGVYLPLLCMAWVIASAAFTGVWWMLFGLSAYFMASFFSTRVNPLGPIVLLMAFVAAIACVIVGGAGFGWLCWPGAYILMHMGYAAFRNNYRSAMIRSATLSELAFLMLLADGIIKALWFPTHEDNVYQLTLEETPTRLPPSVREIWKGKQQ